MKLAAKLVSIIVLMVVGVLIVYGALSVRRELRQFDRDNRRNTYLLGHALKDLLADVWQTKGEAYALELIADANRLHPMVHVRWVWLNAAPGSEHHSRVAVDKLGPLRNGHDVTIEKRNPNSHGYLYTYVPVAVVGDRLGALELSESLAIMDNYAGMTVIRTLILIAVLVLLSAAFLVLLGFHMIGRPLRTLIDKTRRVGRGDLSNPVEIHGHDEIAELGRSLNLMCQNLEEARRKAQIETEERINALEQLRHEDRLRTIGRLASGVAHELGTPLNIVSGRAMMIESGDLSTEEITSSAGIIGAQAERMTSIIREMLDFARRRPSEMRPTDLGMIVHQTVEILTPLARKHSVTLCIEENDSPTPATVDPRQLEQVLSNLIINAVQSMQQPGEVRVGISSETASFKAIAGEPRKEWWRLDVVDQGHGIRAEDFPHLFEPFFSSKPAGKGTGLGLPIVQGIVDEHGGWLNVESEIGKGSCFSIFLPRGDV